VCAPECPPNQSQFALEAGIASGIYLDVRKRQQLFEVTSVARVKDVMEKVK
jgi:hypothetical protein